MLAHLYDEHGVWTQRKNAANKLQHSRLATLAVYHIRHRVLHHIDTRAATVRHPIGDCLKPARTKIASTLERGPDFAEHGDIPS